MIEHAPPQYRGRLAPSPTGLLHLGHARTFWVAAERARQAGGTLILRNEDLDPARSRPEYARAMMEDLRWLGISWDEEPAPGQGEGPSAKHAQSASEPGRSYRQSERRPLYLAAWRRLVERGYAYPCRCSRRDVSESLGESGQAPHEQPEAHAGDTPGSRHLRLDAAGDDEPIYPGTCRPSAARNSLPVPASPHGVNWRFRVPDGEKVCFKDGNLGEHCYIAGRDFGDFLIWRRDDVPAYQLAVTVDDAGMGITEVVRGADLLKSTARQQLLYRALGLAAPDWFHCPLVTDEAGRRLAKRTDSLSIRALRESGRSPEEVLALAGISSEKGNGCRRYT